MSAVASRLGNIKRRGINSREIAQLLATTPTTVSRWSTGRVQPQGERLQLLLTLEWIVEQLSELFEPEEARLWLFSPHRLLDGRTPADRIQNGRPDEVLVIIDQLRDGAYV